MIIMLQQHSLSFNMLHGVKTKRTFLIVHHGWA